jgi:glutamine amidotransferase
MCEMLGMSANVPTDIVFSFTGLMQRGGLTGPHRDGWGIAFYEGKGIRVFQDPRPSYESEVAELVRRYPIKSEIVIGHIRHANVGSVCLANTHPFVRELWGQNWCFAHNGQLAGFVPSAGHYQPVGTTDSESAFCDMLNQIRQRFSSPVDGTELVETLVACCQRYRELGVFNCLLSNGEWLFTFCTTKLAQITRRAPFGPAHLKDAEVQVDFQSETSPGDVVTVLATEPLTTNEAWDLHSPGTWTLWKAGECVMQGSVAPS